MSATENATTTKRRGPRKSTNDPKLEELWALQRKLPFMGEPGADRFHWTLPRSGLYFGGCKAGAASAIAFLKYLRETQHLDRGFSDLQMIALDMLGDRRPRRMSASESLKGQAVGFFSTIDEVLRSCAPLLGWLDNQSFDVLAAKVRQGLAHSKADQEAWERSVRSDAAKQVSRDNQDGSVRAGATIRMASF